MTTNIERAAEVIDRWTQDGSELNSAVGSTYEIAETLADAGLLMPDLPAPEEVEEGKPYWYSDTYGIAVGRLTPGGRRNVLFWDSEPGGVAYMGVEGARELAYAMLAAAKLAEEQE